MQVVNLKIKDLKPYEKNAKLHPKENIDAIKKSIEKYGFNDAIGIWGKQNIITDVLIMIALQVTLKTCYEAIILPLTTYLTKKVSSYENNKLNTK